MKNIKPEVNNMKHQQFLCRFNENCNKWAAASPDELYEAFIEENGLRWADRVAKIVSPQILRENRRGFFDFYFDLSLPLSARSDPRSGVFVRDPVAEGGKTELLLHYSMGIETFAELANVKRVISGGEQSVCLGSSMLPLDFGEYEEVRHKLLYLMDLPDPKVVWDDAIIKPSFDDALNQAKIALLETAKVDYYDSVALYRLMHVVLCGGHCQTCGPSGPRPIMSIPEKMSEILTITAAIRAAAKKLQTSLKRPIAA